MQTARKTRPSLRFPEYSGDWKEFRLGQFLIPALRPIPKPDEEFLSVGVRSHCRGTFNRGALEPEDIAMDTLYEVKSGDLVVNITFAWEGAIAIVKEENEGGLVSHRFPTYIFDEAVTGPDFFRNVFVQDRFRYFLKVISPGGAGRNRVLDKKDFLKLKIRLPETGEQEKINAFLSAVDEKIFHLERKEELWTKYKQAAMQKLFSQALRLKDGDGNNFPTWDEVSFDTVIELRKEKYNPESNKTSYRCIELEHLDQETGRLLGFTDSADHKSIKNVFRHGDILFGKLRPYLKKYWHAQFAGVCSSEIWVIKPKERTYRSDYVFYLIQSNDFLNAANISSGSKMPRADWEYVANSPVRVSASPVEQKMIADFLGAIDQKITLVSAQLERNRAFKKGLLQQMFV